MYLYHPYYFFFFFFLMIRRPPRSTLSSSSAASDVYKRQVSTQSTGGGPDHMADKDSLGHSQSQSHSRGSGSSLMVFTVLDMPAVRLTAAVLGSIGIIVRFTPASPDPSKDCPELIGSAPPGACSGCKAFWNQTYSSGVLPCFTIGSFAALGLSALWFGLSFFMIQLELRGRDPFKNARDQLLCAYQMAFLGFIVLLLSDNSLGSFTGLGDVLSASVFGYASLWVVMFVTAPFPSQEWVQQSRRSAALFALVQFCILAAGVVNKGDSYHAAVWSAVCKSVVAFMSAWAMGFQLCRAWPLLPPSKTALWDATRLLVGGRVDWDRPAGERTSPGFLSACAVVVYLSFWFAVALVQVMNTHLVGLESCDDASGSLLAVYRVMTCMTQNLFAVNLEVLSCLLFLDTLVHRIHWTGTTQLVLFDTMKGLDWHKYQMASAAWEAIELIAAGSEGEIHLAELEVGGRLERVAAKVPHIDGMDALRQVLEETAVWIRVQENAEPDDQGTRHIVPLVGFCFDLPEVATMLMYCDGGDLCQRIASARRIVADPGLNQVDSGIDSLATRVQWALEVSMALRTLHRQGIAHLDIKSDNVLLHEGTAYLTDFGMASPKLSEGKDWRVPACTGTLAFMAPELYAEGRGASEMEIRCNAAAADVFSFGFLLYECLALEREPLCRRQSSRPLSELVTVAPTLEPGELSRVAGEVSLPEEMARLVGRCFGQRAGGRPRMEEIVVTLQDCLVKLADKPVGTVIGAQDSSVNREENQVFSIDVP
eukprot:TRINITY_DN10224_c0_g2_i12.p1 TRINITY_DN10224_c0_g2~~TRINITY_DN10224_c0_g2_i12.p1  ORF type:complete len:765 (+),score=156.26 TRINITY_DN10224_c0_g2_i12:85-2379(+)